MSDLQGKGADQNRTGVLSHRADLQGKTETNGAKAASQSDRDKKHWGGA